MKKTDCNCSIIRETAAAAATAAAMPGIMNGLTTVQR